MGVYTVIAVAIIIYCVGKEWLEPKPPKDKVLDRVGFDEYRKDKYLTGNAYLRSRDKFYVTPEELERRTKWREEERRYKDKEKYMEMYGEKYGIELYDKYFKN